MPPPLLKRFLLLHLEMPSLKNSSIGSRCFSDMSIPCGLNKVGSLSFFVFYKAFSSVKVLSASGGWCTGDAVLARPCHRRAQVNELHWSHKYVPILRSQSERLPFTRSDCLLHVHLHLVQEVLAAATKAEYTCGGIAHVRVPMAICRRRGTS